MIEIETLAIIVGISKYQESEMFPDLPGARSDSAWLHRFFLAKGLPDENIVLLIDEKATKRNIIRAIREWVLKTTLNNIRLFIFFSSHGIVTQEGGALPESVLITYDTEYSDKLGTGISMSELVRSIRRLILSELYIFLDACFMSVGSVARTIGEIPNLNLFSGIKEKQSFLCMVANNERKAIESRKGGLGILTSSVISKVAYLESSKEKTLSRLIEEIQNYFDFHDLGLPFVILAGSINNWPFEIKSNKNSTNTIGLSTRYIERIKEKYKINLFLMENSPLPVSIIGEAGVGKTSLAYDLHKSLAHTVFIKPKYNSKFEDIITDIIEKCNSEILCYAFSQAQKTNLSESINYISHNVAQLIVFIDGADYLDIDVIDSFLNVMVDSGIQVCLTSRKILNCKQVIKHIECSRFSYEETKIFLNEYKIYDSGLISHIFRKTNGVAIKIKQEMYSENKEFTVDNYHETILKIINCKFILEIDSFCRIMEISLSDIIFLEESGVLYKVGSLYYVHDSVKENIKYYKNKEYINLAMEYWYQELKKRPNSEYPRKAILELVPDIEDNFIFNFDTYISASIKQYITAGEFLNVQPIYTALKDKIHLAPETLSLISEILSNIGDFNNVSSIYNSFTTTNYSDNQKINLSYIRSLWWKGSYKEAIKISRDIINNSNDGKIQSKAILEEAICFFFLGQWDLAKKSIKIAENIKECSANTLGWCKLIDGTIDTIRGNKFEAGAWRLKDAISILSEEGDIAGLAIACGNLGEALWKKGDYSESIHFLDEGYMYAEIGNMQINMIENKRNKLQLEIRFNGPFTQLSNSLISYLSDFSIDQIGSMEIMQVWNTLATAFIYRNDLLSAKKYIDLSYDLTIDNLEYHIYTLGNNFLYLMMINDINNSKKNLHNLIELAITGENNFALKQIYDDFSYVIKRYGIEDIDSIEKIINKNQLEKII